MFLNYFHSFLKAFIRKILNNNFFLKQFYTLIEKFILFNFIDIYPHVMEKFFSFSFYNIKQIYSSIDTYQSIK